MRNFEKLIGKKIERLFVIVWTPWGEDDESNFDVSFGFVFQNELNSLCVIRVDKNELWSPYLKFQPLPQTFYEMEDYYLRTKMWMDAKEDTDLKVGYEYYDASKSELFKNILNEEIMSVTLIGFEDNNDPFGVKILFNNDFIVSTPHSYGNTIRTKMFNVDRGIEEFKKLGKIVFTKL